MSNQTDKKEYCIAERLDTICYHQNTEFCQLCKRNEDDRNRLKSDVQYDLLCLAETTSSGYMTHGNVKLCGKCMSELLMWLDADDFCSYGEREGE